MEPVWWFVDLMAPLQVLSGWYWVQQSVPAQLLVLPPPLLLLPLASARCCPPASCCAAQKLMLALHAAARTFLCMLLLVCPRSCTAACRLQGLLPMLRTNGTAVHAALLRSPTSSSRQMKPCGTPLSMWAPAERLCSATTLWR